jgi:hypothetical protein
MPNIKLIVGALIVLIISAGYFVIKSQKAENTQLIGQVAVQDSVIKKQDDVIDKGDKSNKSSEAVRLDTQVKVEEVRTKHAVIKDSAHEQLDAITKAPSDMGNPMSVKEKEDAQSAVVIRTLWESYCVAAPGSEGCTGDKVTPIASAASPITVAESCEAPPKGEPQIIKVQQLIDEHEDAIEEISEGVFA